GGGEAGGRGGRPPHPIVQIGAILRTATKDYIAKSSASGTYGDRNARNRYLCARNSGTAAGMATERAKISTATRIVRRSAGTSPRTLSTDICVLGAGIAGVSAALEAARLKRRVALVDGLPALGGQAVNSIIGTFCGLFGNGTHGPQLTHGIADGILRDLGRQGALHYRRGGPANTTVIMYDEGALSRWIEEAVRTAGITVLLGAILRGVTRDGGRLRELDLATRYGDVKLSAAGFVDATGDAALTWQAGFACREHAGGPIYGTQMM